MSVLPMSLPTLTAQPLTRTQKAAVVVHLLLSEGADPGISELPEDAQRRLVAALVSLRFVDRGTLSDVIAEFAGALDADGLRLPSSMVEVLTLLDGRISPDLLSEFSAEAPEGIGGLGTGAWTALGAMPPEQLMPILDSETPEVCAILLSKLSPKRAADLLAQMEPGRAATVTAAFAGTEQVPPDVISRIGMSLGRAAASRPVKGFDTPPVDRVGAILNAATSGDRANLLESLENSSPDFAARVRGAVFSWENISERVDARDLPRVLREVENDDVVTALASDVDGPVATFVLGAISARLADQIRSEIEDRGEIPLIESEEAQAKIAAAIRDLEAEGAISFTSPDE